MLKYRDVRDDVKTTSFKERQCPVCGRLFDARWNYTTGKYAICCSWECGRGWQLLERKEKHDLYW